MGFVSSILHDIIKHKYPEGKTNRPECINEDHSCLEKNQEWKATTYFIKSIG